MAQFVAPAAPRAELWRTLCGLLLWAVLTGVIAVLVMVPLVIVAGPDKCRRLADAAMTPGTATGVIGMLFAFLPMMLALVLTVRLLMRRGLSSLIGPTGPFLRNFIRVALPLMALWLLLMPLTINAGDVTPHLTLAQLTPWLPAALIGLLVQTATEELFFRGYLQQQLAARFAARWVWMGVPSVLFGLAHYPGTDALPFGLFTVAWATCFGLAAADLTARSGNLGAAWALHLTNNIAAILLVSFAGPLGGLSLYTVRPEGDGAALIYVVLDAVSLLVAWLVARLMLRR